MDLIIAGLILWTTYTTLTTPPPPQIEQIAASSK